MLALQDSLGVGLSVKVGVHVGIGDKVHVSVLGTGYSASYLALVVFAQMSSRDKPKLSDCPYNA